MLEIRFFVHSSFLFTQHVAICVISGGGVGGGAGGSRAGSVGGLHKSMTRLSSSQQINLVPVTSSGSGLPPVVNGLAMGLPTNRSVTAINGNHRQGIYGIYSGGVTVTTAQDGAGGRGSM